MKTRFVVVLVLAALGVGGAIVYSVVRQPERPRAVFPNNDAPAAPRRSGTTSEDYKRDREPAAAATSRDVAEGEG